MRVQSLAVCNVIYFTYSKYDDLNYYYDYKVLLTVFLHTFEQALTIDSANIVSHRKWALIEQYSPHHHRRCERCKDPSQYVGISKRRPFRRWIAANIVRRHRTPETKRYRHCSGRLVSARQSGNWNLRRFVQAYPADPNHDAQRP